MTALDVALILIFLALGTLPLLRELARRPMGRRARGQAPGQFAKLSEGLTHYDWLGPREGPVVVCVHGLSTPSFVWLALARPLVRMGFRVLVYDLYGRGYSDRPRGLQTPGLFVRQLQDLLDHQGIKQDFTLIGYSMGGAIATAYAATEHHRLSRLILLAPAGMEQQLGKLAAWAVEWPVVGDWVFHMGYPRLHRAWSQADSEQTGPAQEVAGLLRAQIDYRGYVRSILSSLRGTLRRPQQEAHQALASSGLPVLAIWGREDDVIPIRAMGVMAQWNRTALHEVIEGAGHGLTYTHAEDVAQVIRATMGR